LRALSLAWYVAGYRIRKLNMFIYMFINICSSRGTSSILKYNRIAQSIQRVLDDRGIGVWFPVWVRNLSLLQSIRTVSGFREPPI
jgi:hypothetical protein